MGVVGDVQRPVLRHPESMRDEAIGRFREPFDHDIRVAPKGEARSPGPRRRDRERWAGGDEDLRRIDEVRDHAADVWIGIGPMVPRAAGSLVSHAPEDYPGGSCRQSEKADSEFPTTSIRQSSSFPPR